MPPGDNTIAVNNNNNNNNNDNNFYYRISHFSALAGKYSPILERSNQQD